MPCFDCRLLPVFLLASAVLAVGCGSSGGNGGVIPDDPLPITGEYALSLTSAEDGCGLGPGSAQPPMEVVEQGQDTATVDVPDGGAAGPCGPDTFVRTGNVLERSESFQQQIGSCTVDVTIETELGFFDNDTVAGNETTSLTAAGGDCSAVGLPCQTVVNVTGSRCSGCFDCVVLSPTASDDRRGTFGAWPL